MKVRAIKPINHHGKSYQKGETLEVPEEFGNQLIKHGNAEKVEEKHHGDEKNAKPEGGEKKPEGEGGK